MEIAKVTKIAIQAAVAFQSTRGIMVLLFLLYLAAATACEYIIGKQRKGCKSRYIRAHLAENLENKETSTSIQP